MNPWIAELLVGWSKEGHRIKWIHQPEEIPRGDFCFLLGCEKIVGREILELNNHNLVVHESLLPMGKGWSPLSWQILEGSNQIPVVLFEATEGVDSGMIYLKDYLNFYGHELIEELRLAQAEVTLRLCNHFVKSFPEVLNLSQSQSGEDSFYPRRRPEDSRIDPNRTLAEQFNLLRVVDNERYPAFFELQGFRYSLRVEKIKKSQ